MAFHNLNLCTFTTSSTIIALKTHKGNDGRLSVYIIFFSTPIFPVLPNATNLFHSVKLLEKDILLANYSIRY